MEKEKKKKETIFGNEAALDSKLLLEKNEFIYPTNPTASKIDI